MTNSPEQEVSSHLAIITAAIVEQMDGIQSLILGGSFARGEGSMIRDDSRWVPLKDYDLYAVVAEPYASAAAAAVPAIRTRIYEQLNLPPYHEAASSPTGFQISLEVIPQQAIPRLPHDLSNLELKLTGRVLWGDDFLASIPVTGDRVPPVSGLRHLLNKLIGALELWGPWINGDIPLESSTALAVRYHRCKITLDCISAVLLLKGEWVPSYQARMDQLRRLEQKGPLLPGLSSLLKTGEQALSFKLNPSFPETNEAVKDWQEALAELLSYVEVLSSAVFSYEAGEPADGYKRFLKHARVAFFLPYAIEALRGRGLPPLPGLAQMAVICFSIAENYRMGEIHSVHPLLRAYSCAWAWLSDRDNSAAQTFMSRFCGSWHAVLPSRRTGFREDIIALFKRTATRKRLKRTA